jgi:hypothetical protein
MPAGNTESFGYAEAGQPERNGPAAYRHAPSAGAGVTGPEVPGTESITTTLGEPHGPSGRNQEFAQGRSSQNERGEAEGAEAEAGAEDIAEIGEAL